MTEQSAVSLMHEHMATHHAGRVPPDVKAQLECCTDVLQKLVINNCPVEDVLALNLWVESAFEKFQKLFAATKLLAQQNNSEAN